MLTIIRSRTMPALQTSVSSPPNVSMRLLRPCAPAPSQSLTSSPLTIASPPAASISATTSWAGREVGALAGERGAEVVDDHLGALGGEGEGVGPAEAAPGAGDDDDTSVADAHRLVSCRGSGHDRRRARREGLGVLVAVAEVGVEHARRASSSAGRRPPR